MELTAIESRPHAKALFGRCPFCRQNTAELWFDPAEDVTPYQVRCRTCDARGPKCDCGFESAVPSWEVVERKPDDVTDKPPVSY